MSSDLNSFLFSTSEMTRIFSSAAQLRAMMRFEWALILALETRGIAEAGSASVMEAFLDCDFVERASLEREAVDAGNIAIPFVRQLTAAVKTRSEHAARVIHLGATSQDVLDTALVLQMRDALQLIDEWIVRLDDVLVSQIRAHAGTLLSGRTWLQPGPPTTIGLKLAGTLAALRRNRDRIRSAAERAVVLEFGGAVGTLAPLRDRGLAVSAELAAILELREPELPWHTQRDRLAEIVAVLALLTGTLAKLARDAALLMQAEVSETSEPVSDSRGGSSTMPHKHNPVPSAAVIAVHARMPGLATTMLSAMPQEHERGLGLWQAEWETVPEAFRLASAALAYSVSMIERLAFDPERMRANIQAQLGLPLAESVSAALAPAIGRSAAHDLLRQASRRAAEEKRPLVEVLRQLPEVTAHLCAAELDRLLDPENYLGSTQAFIARVLGDKVETSSERIHFELSGAVGGPAILLLNSLGSDLRMWSKLVPSLEPSYHVIRCDTRGHGRSELPPGPCTLDDLGRDALSVLDHAGVDRAHICGLSLGGIIAMWIALHAPQRAGRIVLANTSARIGSTAMWDERIAAVRSLGMNPLAQATLGRWFTPSYRDQNPGEMEIVREMIASTNPEGYVACCRVLRDADLRGSLSAIEAKCLVIAGAHDPATPPGDGRSLNAALRDSRFVELDASHLSAWERAKEFAATTLTFFAEEDCAHG